MSYGKVHSTFWTDRKVRKFSDAAKNLALYLLTGPHRNLIGAMRVPVGYIAADLEWSEKKTADIKAELVRAGFILTGEDGWILVCNQLKYDRVENRNQGLAAFKLVDAIDDPTIKVAAAERVLTAIKPFAGSLDIQIADLESLIERSRKGTERVSEGLPTPEPAPAPIPAPAPAPARDDLDEAVDIWNEAADEIGLPTVQKLTPERRTKLRKRLDDCGGLEGWRAAIGKVRDSPFLRGGGNSGWRADFDFLLKASKFTKLMEGGYDDKGSGGHRNGFAQLIAESRLHGSD